MSIEDILRRLRNVVVKLIPEDSRLFRWLFRQGLRLTSFQKHKRRTMMRIDIPVAEHCNLSCKCCSAYGPIAGKSFLDVPRYKHDIARLSALTNGELEELWFTGGEPLLHPQIVEIVQVARENFPKAPIALLTNGVLLPKMPPAFWESCRKYGIDIYISRYPIRLDIDKIFAVAKQYAVHCDYLGGKHESIKVMWKYPLDLTGSQPLRDSFDICNQVNSCIRMKNGRIYPCNTIACIDHFNGYFGQQLKVAPADYLELDGVASVDEIFDFLITPKPFCRYCNRRGVVTGIAWDVSKKDISEWT